MTKKLKQIKAIVFLLNILLFASFSNGQNKQLDSLFSQLKQAKYDSVKCSILLDIGDYYEHKNIDTALYFYEKSLKLAEIKKLKKDMAQANRYIAALYIDNSDKTIALMHYQKALTIYREINDIKGISKTHNNIGLVNYKMGNYDIAIENYMKSLKMREETGDKKGMMFCYFNIGGVHKDQNNFDKALEYFTKALKIAEELNDKEGIYLGNNNLGVMQDLMGNQEKAIEYINKSLKIVEELDDKKGILTCYNNLGNSYKRKGDFENALKYYNKSLKISEEIMNKNTSAMILNNIATMHMALSDSAKLNHKGQKIITEHLNAAIKFGLRAINLGREIMSKPIENNVAKVLMKTYKRLGDNSKSLYYAEIFIDTKDSMFSQEKTKSLAEAEKKFESEKKQLQIDKLSKEKELQNETIARKNAESKKQRIIIMFVFCSLLLVVVFSVFLFRLFMQKKKANLILARQKQQIEIQNSNLQQANEEINAQRDEIEAQRDLVVNQKDELEIIHKEVTDSINYAKRIQQAMLPDLASTRGLIPLLTHETFILFRPKDIVSGDFYWSSKVNEYLIYAVADCTGHGVPGAFMSMLGVSFLNEIVRKKEVTQASHVLDQLRESIIDALKQTGESGTQKDGMDMSLIVINLQASTSRTSVSEQSDLEALRESSVEALPQSNISVQAQPVKIKPTETEPQSNNRSYNAQWSGANNPLWLVRSSKEMPPFKKVASLEEVKPDKMPIAIYERMEDFTNHELQLYKGDTIFLISDGYEDQFGGEKGKKFLSKNLKQLLIANCQLPMNEQKQILEKTLIEWIGEGEQIDDITLLGIRI
ncbi:MAG: hypothetical protein A2046_00090 [Bacteroidetes bacterium GWA2_30_7]|nr:MAG: hypothetical protein A2046_00090 [Bacteroidetes bacterium GWA2_30_7]